MSRKQYQQTVSCDSEMLHSKVFRNTFFLVT